MASKISASLLLLSLIATNEALKILVIFPMITKSHSILGHAVVDRLLEAGHEVTHISSFPHGKSVANLRELDVSHVSKMLLDEAEKMGAFKMKNMMGSTSTFEDSIIFYYFIHLLHKNIIQDPVLVEFLSDPNVNFDAVIMEYFFSDLLAGIPALFEAPLIWFCTTQPHWQTIRLMDNIPNPAYNVDIFTPYVTPLNFWQRSAQLLKIVKKYVMMNFIMAPLESWVYNSVYPEIASKRGVTIPSYSDAVYNGSLMFINSHPAIGTAMKLPQSAISVAGFHMTDDVKPLPKDLQTLMDGAKHGVIYFSMGSFMTSNGMTDEMKSSLINIFRKLDQIVIWKFETDMKVPDNVHLVKWVPQPSVLAHPNLKLFITHGGQISTIEAIHYGVPLVGIPLFADQHINMATVTAKGFAIKVTLAEDMAGELEVAVKKVLTDESYRNRAKELSAIFHDRPMKPGAAISHWVEHVVSTRGAPHLRSPALNTSLVERLYLDLLALIAIVVVAAWMLLRRTLDFMNSKKVKMQ